MVSESEDPDKAEEPSRVPHPRNTLNDLPGDRFLYFTKSVLTTAYPRVYGHDLRRRHGANKPPQLMAALIEFFTKAGMSVLDPFAGVGGTLLGASLAEPGPRRCVGIEINREWIDIYRQILQEYPDLTAQTIVEGDCAAVMDRWLAGETFGDGLEARFDFVVTDPPYNIHLRQTMSGAAGERYAESGHANRRSEYNMRSNEERDLANLSSYEEYLAAMGQVFDRCYRLLRPGRYMAIIVRNAYQNGEYIFTHVDLARAARDTGFVPKGEIVWSQAGTRLRPYGYPSSFVPNIAHQYIVVLQRPRDA
jgi:DNA modification methylase